MVIFLSNILKSQKYDFVSRQLTSVTTKINSLRAILEVKKQDLQ